MVIKSQIRIERKLNKTQIFASFATFCSNPLCFLLFKTAKLKQQGQTLFYIPKILRFLTDHLKLLFMDLSTPKTYE